MDQPTPSEQRRRWINIGEIVAVSGLLVSGLALWNSWGRGDDRPAVVIDSRKPVPLVLRGKVDDDGKAIRIAPLEGGHALEEITIVTGVAGPSGAKSKASFGSEPVLSAAGVEGWLPKDTPTDDTGSLTVTVAARYVEHGATRTASGTYIITYGWRDGGLFSGKSLRLTGFSRA